MKLSVQELIEEKSAEEIRLLESDLNHDRQFAPIDSARYRWLFGGGDHSASERPPESATRIALLKILTEPTPPEVLAEAYRFGCRQESAETRACLSDLIVSLHKIQRTQGALIETQAQN